jgi:hypothetical protein
MLFVSNLARIQSQSKETANEKDNIGIMIASGDGVSNVSGMRNLLLNVIKGDGPSIEANESLNKSYLTTNINSDLNEASEVKDINDNQTIADIRVSQEEFCEKEAKKSSADDNDQNALVNVYTNDNPVGVEKMTTKTDLAQSDDKQRVDDSEGDMDMLEIPSLNVDDQQWNLKKVLTLLELTCRGRPKLCSTDSCSLRAAFVYESTDASKRQMALCLDCNVRLSGKNIQIVFAYFLTLILQNTTGNHVWTLPESIICMFA